MVFSYPPYKRKWTPEQLKTLEDMRQAGCTLGVIARELKMPQGEVSVKTKELNLPSWYHGRFKPKK